MRRGPVRPHRSVWTDRSDNGYFISGRVPRWEECGRVAWLEGSCGLKVGESCVEAEYRDGAVVGEFEREHKGSRERAFERTRDGHDTPQGDLADWENRE
jgi:hypothetical protein